MTLETRMEVHFGPNSYMNIKEYAIVKDALWQHVSAIHSYFGEWGMAHLAMCYNLMQAEVIRV